MGVVFLAGGLAGCSDVYIQDSPMIRNLETLLTTEPVPVWNYPSHRPVSLLPPPVADDNVLAPVNMMMPAPFPATAGGIYDAGAPIPGVTMLPVAAPGPVPGMYGPPGYLESFPGGDAAHPVVR